MALNIDPDENELNGLRRATDWRRKRVIEIGCGNGRLTLRLARLGARGFAIDPDAKLIRAARLTLTKRLAKRISYRVGKAEPLGHTDESFDRAVFSWVL